MFLVLLSGMGALCAKLPKSTSANALSTTLGAAGCVGSKLALVVWAYLELQSSKCNDSCSA